MMEKYNNGLLLVAAIILSGCSTTQAPSWQVDPPRAALMKAPQPLPDVKDGEDLYGSHASLRAQYAREATKASSLQRYVRIILKKQRGMK